MITITVIIGVVSVARAERTVGLFINDANAWDGYTMFAPGSYPATYLINNKGELVHRWEYEYGGSPTALTEDGIYYQAFDLDTNHPVFGKPLGGVESLDWDGNVLWHYDYWGDDFSRHHATELLPNGNVLMIAYKIRDSLECVQAGKNPANLKGGMVFADYLVEVEPVGSDSANIVWEWHFWDHVIQDFDSTKDNYDVVADHPELLDLNAGEQKKDWPHLNGVFYYKEYDQILITAGHTSEIYAIDHSTTTVEASGHTGGNYGKGGDFLYRWGDPQNYDQGDSTTKILSLVHCPAVVPAGYPGAGHFTMFGNGRDWGYSSIVEIDPPIDGLGNYTMAGNRYGPEAPFWTYSAPVPEDFYANNGGSAQRLPNGNTLVGYNPAGEIFEVTDAGDMVWRYVNPVGDNGPVPENVKIENNSIGGVIRYPLDYAAFESKDLTPQGPIELAGAAETRLTKSTKLDIAGGIFKDAATISYQLGEYVTVRIKVYNVLGQEVRTLVNETKQPGTYTLVWDGRDNQYLNVAPGVYFVNMSGGGVNIQKRVVRVR